MTDTPSEAAQRRRDELVIAEPRCSMPRAFARYIDEVDRVARSIRACPLEMSAVDALESLMLPDPPDPDEELAREKIMAIWSDGTPDRERVIAVFAEALREQGRLTDAK